MIPWSNGEDAWPTSRKVLVRFQPGSLLTTWSVSVSAGTARRVVRRCGKAEDRVQFPDGPLEFWGAGPMGRRLACTQAIGVRFPGAPLGNRTSKLPDENYSLQRPASRAALRLCPHLSLCPPCRTSKSKRTSKPPALFSM
mgnify:CR=1 FL=1